MAGKNVTEFKKLLLSKEIKFEEREEKDYVAIIIYNRSDITPLITYYLVFSNNDGFVEFLSSEIISGISPRKKIEILEAINECNCKYNYVKFILQENCVKVRYNINTDEHFNPEMFYFYLVVTIEAIEEEYQQLMRTVWG